MEIGLIIVLFAIVISTGASELWERIKWHRAYTDELERTVQRQERSLQHYRFMRLQKEMEKEMTAGAGTPDGQKEMDSVIIVSQGKGKVND